MWSHGSGRAGGRPSGPSRERSIGAHGGKGSIGIRKNAAFRVRHLWVRLSVDWMGVSSRGRGDGKASNGSGGNVATTARARALAVGVGGKRMATVSVRKQFSHRPRRRPRRNDAAGWSDFFNRMRNHHVVAVSRSVHAQQTATGARHARGHDGGREGVSGTALSALIVSTGITVCVRLSFITCSGRSFVSLSPAHFRALSRVRTRGGRPPRGLQRVSARQWTKEGSCVAYDGRAAGAQQIQHGIVGRDTCGATQAVYGSRLPFVPLPR
jgi:hypothetical protein